MEMEQRTDGAVVPAKAQSSIDAKSADAISVETAFQKQLSSFGLTLSEEQIAQLARYYEDLIETNKVMNLTAITEKKDVYTKHFLDSLSLFYAAKASGIEIPQGSSLIDVGTGAGFPGLVLKIARPDLALTLLDSLAKRLKFLSQVIRDTDMRGVSLVHARAEDGAREKSRRDSFDFAVARAVAPLPVLLEYCLPYVKVGGYFCTYKTASAEEEIRESERALKLLQGEVVSTAQFTLPGTDVQRSIIFIRKCAKTPKTYPRKAGTPKNKPL